MIRSFFEALKFKQAQRSRLGKPLNGIAVLATALFSFMPQPTSASQTWAPSDTGDVSSSEYNGEDEWVVFYETSLPAAKMRSARESYAIKRNDLRTGVQGACGWVPINPKNTAKKHCGSSAVWIKGDHSQNPNVRYRTSLTLYGIKCYDWEYSKDQFISYSATGDVIQQREKLGQLRAIIPGSFEERVARAHCESSQ